MDRQKGKIALVAGGSLRVGRATGCPMAEEGAAAAVSTGDVSPFLPPGTR